MGPPCAVDRGRLGSPSLGKPNLIEVPDEGKADGTCGMRRITCLPRPDHPCPPQVPFFRKGPFMLPSDAHVHDLVGIGFGPSNLALAIALRERETQYGETVDAVFLEKQPRFGWHRGMLIEGTTMQVSFLKDLVTLRNPSSGFSFLSYLQDRGRLPDFINHKTMFPSRAEFHDYLDWAASAFHDQVEYGSEVVGVTPVVTGGAVEHLDVIVRHGGCSDELTTRRTRNLVIAAGLEPALPEGVVSGE